MLYQVTGTDQFGNPKSEAVDIRPPLFFWLGAEADPEPKIITALVPAAPQFIHEYRHISYGIRYEGGEARWFQEFT